MISLKDLFTLKLSKPEPKGMPDNWSIFWDSNKHGSYVKDAIRKSILNPTCNAEPTPRT